MSCQAFSEFVLEHSEKQGDRGFGLYPLVFIGFFGGKKFNKNKVLVGQAFYVSERLLRTQVKKSP
jgi:hypothetical protein